jgi:LysR family glycine cleavage system transcriptional activator
VRLDASLERRNLRGEGFDLAIRYVRAGGEGRPLFDESMQPVCSPQLLRRGPPLKTPADLRHHTLLRATSMGDPPTEWEPWLQAVGLPDLQPASTSPSLRTARRSPRRSRVRAWRSGAGRWSTTC